MRTQMEETLRRKGELPNGMSLDLTRQYVNMTGNGEIWLNSVGLPVREQIHLSFPPEKGATEWVEADVTTNFSRWQSPVVTKPAALWHNLRGAQWSRLFTQGLTLFGMTPQQLQEMAFVLGLLCLLAGLVGLIICYRHERKLYIGLATALIGAMLVIPLLNAQQVYAFGERQQVKATANAAKTDQEKVEAQTAKFTNKNFDPHRNPLERGDQRLKMQIRD